ncbi:hypothetical protein FRC12_002639 [Ceratobasidium sp. 428]|nr:hypothetical protein FRC12_002639 [Ceratobasidium sp. 428]
MVRRSIWGPQGVLARLVTPPSVRSVRSLHLVEAASPDMAAKEPRKGVGEASSRVQACRCRAKYNVLGRGAWLIYTPTS